MVQSEHDKQHRSGSHDDGPCVERCLTGSRSCCLACVDEHTGKIDEKSGSYQFGDVVERSLPADIFGLVLLRELCHVESVEGDVMGGAAEGYHCKQSDADCEEAWQMQGEGDACEAGAADDLCRHDDHALAREKFQKRTPEELEGPGKHDDGCPECDLAVSDAESLEHQHAYHVEDYERQSHGEICRRNPP